MKKIKISVACYCLSALMLTSCIGSFGLFNKVRNWNEQTTNHKFLNELIFIGLWIVPVYEVSLVADVFIFNSVEFWTGNNPMAVGTVKEINSENGKLLVTATKDGYSIDKEGVEEPIELKFDKEAQSWNVTYGNENYEIMKLLNDGTVDLNLQNGKYINVTPDAMGVTMARDAVMGNTFFATR